MKSMVITIAAAGALWLSAAAPVLAEDADAAALAPFQQFADGMNAGDMKKAAAAYTASATIIDEFGPHQWTSFGAWAADAAAYFKAGGVEGLKIQVSPPSFKAVDANFGYAVAPTVLSFTVKGKPTTEKGLFTFSTAKTADGWRLTGWAWSTL